MLKYGLKLWTNNEKRFAEAKTLLKKEVFDFVELYNYPAIPHNYQELSLLRNWPIMIHNANDQGFHEFIIKKRQYAIWKKTLRLANFFNSQYIIVHPGQKHTFKTFYQNLKRINDPRILVENMAGLDKHGQIMYGQTLSELKKINTIKDICFDFEKAVKSACQQKIEYKHYIKQALNDLQPFYFHISGGNINNPIDEHKNLWDSNIDFKWIKKILFSISKHTNTKLVFETPKVRGALSNDIKNINYFKKI